MSIEYLAWGWKLKLEPTLREVYMAMADHADSLGRNIRPSIALIVYKIDASPRTVQRAIRSLEQLGILVRDRKGGGRKTNEWHILIPEKLIKPPFREVNPRQIDTPEASQLRHPRGVTATTPDPYIEPSKEIKSRKRDLLLDALIWFMHETDDSADINALAKRTTPTKKALVAWIKEKKALEKIPQDMIEHIANLIRDMGTWYDADNSGAERPKGDNTFMTAWVAYMKYLKGKPTLTADPEPEPEPEPDMNAIDRLIGGIK